ASILWNRDRRVRLRCVSSVRPALPGNDAGYAAYIDGRGCAADPRFATREIGLLERNAVRGVFDHTTRRSGSRDLGAIDGVGERHDAGRRGARGRRTDSGSEGRDAVDLRTAVANGLRVRNAVRRADLLEKNHIEIDFGVAGGGRSTAERGRS